MARPEREALRAEGGPGVIVKRSIPSKPPDAIVRPSIASGEGTRCTKMPALGPLIVPRQPPSGRLNAYSEAPQEKIGHVMSLSGIASAAISSCEAATTSAC